jgi:heptosyltransferase II
MSTSKRNSREPKWTWPRHDGTEARCREERPTAMKIAVFCPNLIGDTVMATPTFRALRQGFPAARIVGVIKPSVAPTLDSTPWFDDRVCFDPKSLNHEHRTLATLLRLRREQFDLAILLPNSFRPAWLAWLAGIPRRVGYVRYGRGILLTDRLYDTRDASGKRLPTPIVEAYLKLARQVGCVVDSVRIELATTDEDEDAADRAFASLGLGDERRTVCLNTGGAFGPAKNWPVPHFAELARRLVDVADVSVLVLCGPNERESAREIVAAADRRLVVSLADQPLGIGLTKACVRRASLLITTDSGPRHFAAAFQTPVITLFGPTHIAWTRTNYPHAWHILHRVPCGPCQRPVCPERHHRCMRDLSPEAVFRVALRSLEGTARNVSEQVVLAE